jgi:hypothetical protein
MSVKQIPLCGFESSIAKQSLKGEEGSMPTRLLLKFIIEVIYMSKDRFTTADFRDSKKSGERFQC